MSYSKYNSSCLLSSTHFCDKYHKFHGNKHKHKLIKRPQDNLKGTVGVGAIRREHFMCKPKDVGEQITMTAGESDVEILEMKMC